MTDDTILRSARVQAAIHDAQRPQMLDRRPLPVRLEAIATVAAEEAVVAVLREVVDATHFLGHVKGADAVFPFASRTSARRFLADFQRLNTTAADLLAAAEKARES